MFLQEPEGGSGGEVLLPIFRGEPPSNVPWARHCAVLPREYPSDVGLFPRHSPVSSPGVVENLDF